MSSLRAWLEFTDIQTGSPRKVELTKNSVSIGRTGGDLRLPDGALSELHAIVTQERGQYIIRDLSSKNGTFLNNRPIVEAQLTNLDQIRIGSTELVFHAAYIQDSEATPEPQHPSASELTPAPGRYLAGPTGGKTLFPPKMLFHPLRFWPAALETGVLQLRRTWLIHGMTAGIIVGTAFIIGSSQPFLHLGFLLFATTVALALMAMTCSVFFAFDSMPDAPHRLSQSMRFTFCVSPFLLLIQCGFLIWASKSHLTPSRYFLAGLLPTACVWIFSGVQSQYAFAASLSRGLAFAITASVPWNLFMTGLMSFMV